MSSAITKADFYAGLIAIAFLFFLNLFEREKDKIGFSNGSIFISCLSAACILAFGAHAISLALVYLSTNF